MKATEASRATHTPSEAGMLIELEHADVIRDGVQVLRDVSLGIALGQHSVVLGPNGCGKSTLVKLIDRSLYPVARQNGPAPVRLFGQSHWNVAELRPRLGMVSADLHAGLNRLRGLDVEDAVVSGFWGTHGIPTHLQVTRQMLERTEETLALMQIAHLRYRRLSTLSAGEARRVLIARALVHKPQALLLDEPCTGLDIASRCRLLELLRQVICEGITLVLVTHHLEEVLPETTQAILLREGRVFAQGNPESVLTSENMTALFGLPLRVVPQADGFRQLLAAA